jgi:hypothetical protein
MLTRHPSSSNPNREQVIARLEHILGELHDEAGCELIGLVLKVMKDPTLLHDVIYHRIQRARNEKSAFERIYKQDDENDDPPF